MCWYIGKDFNGKKIKVELATKKSSNFGGGGGMHGSRGGRGGGGGGGISSQLFVASERPINDVSN